MEPIGDYSLDDLLKKAMERKASDLHVTTELPPQIRVDGRLKSLDFEPLSPVECQRLIFGILTDRQIADFESHLELDLSYGVSGLGRFRVNVYRQRGSIGAALRVIPSIIPSFEELHLPKILRDLASHTSGLILVTGPTGCGKSTTLAAMIDHINNTLEGHVMTLEDPIEYLHKHAHCMVNQREVGADTRDFGSALRAVLREDPDVVLVGEMRDLETLSTALTIAETGHLVLGTLHTRNAPQSIDRIIDIFPPYQQEQIRVQLAGSLQAVVAQQLLPTYGRPGRVPAVEVMVATAGVRNLIREAKTHQIYSLMETGAEEGMQTMDRDLARLVRSGQVSMDEAQARAVDGDSFRRWLSMI
ncbi:MAG: PilT/PilU family type 4a pilus ATPase [Armatimonadetes bacterium]|nr:PilT/PilU family type 4a pilus ATPase [Armatimonadota bacterium]NIO74860.1 PilT/PilU family type 4a pilus ATPase [Armatimonadota bacterium]NIO95622.1 PilT/PilU family type 4a pilus ATPase [Armatimonadota bacterium]